MSNSLSKLRESMSQGENQAGDVDQPQRPARSGQVKKKKGILLPILLVMVGCAVFAFAAWSAVRSPALASILSLSSAQGQAPSAPGNSFAQVEIAKPTYTPAALQPVAQEILPTATLLPTATPTLIPPTDEPTEPVVDEPTSEPTIEPTAVAVEETPQPEGEAVAASEGVAIAEIVPDTPTPVYVAPTAAAQNIPAQVKGSGERWIYVNLSEQRLYAYEGDTLVNSFVVSTGTWQTPTVTGKYKIWIKLRSSSMSGPGYYLPDVPYIMYFYKGYGIHGTYWHNNFGTPMSHGCVNMTITDAEWVYNFASVGTVVEVSY
jgi:lipoprotein-anchoring transpeptidase ErfK/SrfK